MPKFISIAAFATLLALGSAIDPRVSSNRPAPRDLIEKRNNGCPGINPLGGSAPGQVSSIENLYRIFFFLYNY
jgi:hypothetical protein